MKYDLKSIIDNFRIEGEFLSGKPYGSGHINDTFLIRTVEDTSHDYLLQRVNHNIFKNIPKLMENIERVTKHIRKKIIGIPNSIPERECLTLIPAGDEKVYYKDNTGNFWRVFIFIDNSKNYDVVDTPAKAYEGGKAFGKFQAMVSELPQESLYESIPGFHNIETRLENFFRTIKADPIHRVREVSKEIEIVEERADEMKKMMRLGTEGKIPLRITHNDTKFNNVLLDENDKALCVIDLDTVMPGYIHYDFGDSIRTAASTGSEDENDLKKVKMDIRLFEAYAKGFLGETKSFLISIEIETLAFSPKLLTFMMGLRFLTDYIDGDNYYKIYFKDHNLRRARAQFKLLSSMDEQYDDMKEIVKQIAET